MGIARHPVLTPWHPAAGILHQSPCGIVHDSLELLCADLNRAPPRRPRRRPPRHRQPDCGGASSVPSYSRRIKMVLRRPLPFGSGSRQQSKRRSRPSCKERTRLTGISCLFALNGTSGKLFPGIRHIRSKLQSPRNYHIGRTSAPSGPVSTPSST